MAAFPSLPGAPAPLLIAFVAIFGALVGSFLNVVILRVPERRSIAFPGSHCPQCSAPIRWFDNFPVVSWLVLRGKCRSCKKSISARYALVELLTSALFVGVVWRFGLSIATPVYLLFVSVMVALTFIDLDHRIIPNVISLPGIVVGLALSFVMPRGGGFLPASPTAAFVGAIVGGGLLFLISTVYLVVRKDEGMGMGDVKMLGMIGAFLGIAGVGFVFIASSILGSAVGILVMILGGGGAKTKLPFGPFLAVAAILYLFVGPELVTAYVNHSPALRQISANTSASATP